VRVIRTTSLAAVLLGWLAYGPAVAADEKAIIIDNDLAASAEILPVTVAAQKTFKVADFRFGEYVVVSSKLGWAKGSSWEWVGPLASDESTQKFSFEMKGAGPDTASVKAVQKFESGPIKRYELLPGVTAGIDSISSGKDSLVADIELGGEPAATWKLQLNVQRNVAGASERAKASWLTDGTREIAIANVKSVAVDGEDEAMPARGYEFREGDRAIAALQYYGGGYPGSKKHLVVYLRGDLDARTKLLLATAMTAILQSKINATLN